MCPVCPAIRPGLRPDGRDIRVVGPDGRPAPFGVVRSTDEGRHHVLLNQAPALEGMDGAPTTTPSQAILDLRAEMLDPANKRRGIRKNHKKKWADARVLSGVTIRSKA